MKVIRCFSQPSLFEFAKNRLPPSLVAKERSEGYGYGYYIYQRDHVPWLLRGDPVAEIEGAMIRLFHHNYYSDMEALALAYEEDSGHETAIRYSQDPKALPLHK